MKDVKCINCTHMMRITGEDWARCSWCPVYGRIEDDAAKRDCEKYELATNYDVIRRMNEEDLAVVLMCPCDDGVCDNPQMHCRDCVLQWLKEEVAT